MRTSQPGSTSSNNAASTGKSAQSPQIKFQLSAGQTYRFHADTGTALFALTGSLQIAEAPQWFGDAMLAPQQTIVEGQQHIVERSGWVSVSAIRAASIAVVASETAAGPTWNDALNALRQFAHRVTYKTTHLFAR